MYNIAQDLSIVTIKDAKKNKSKTRIKKLKKIGEEVKIGNSKREKGTTEYKVAREKNKANVDRCRGKTKEEAEQQEIELNKLLETDEIQSKLFKEKWQQLKNIIDTQCNGELPKEILPYLETIQQNCNEILECKKQKLQEIDKFKQILIVDFQEACQANIIEHNSLLAKYNLAQIIAGTINSIHFKGFFFQA